MKSKTSLVTGASDGIGFELCQVMASKGYDIVLVARNIEKLEHAAERLRASFNIKIISFLVIWRSPLLLKAYLRK